MPTINDLRRDWLEQIAAYGGMITLFEKAKQRGVENDGMGKPGRVWTGMLHAWRAELQKLLAEYPGDQ